jgi:hypothetical protein
MSDYDKENYDKAQWQAEQEARDEAQTAYRDKMAKARERSARNAKRKIARLHAKLTELGHISEFEDEFGESVLERLEKFGSAFHDLEKGRAGDALSAAQKQVVARMNKKLKELKAKQQIEAEGLDPDAEYERTQPTWKKKTASGFKKKNGFGSKKGYAPRVRHIEDDCPDVSNEPDNMSDLNVSKPNREMTHQKVEPFIPEYAPLPDEGITTRPHKKPFLRLVKAD